MQMDIPNHGAPLQGCHNHLLWASMLDRSASHANPLAASGCRTSIAINHSSASGERNSPVKHHKKIKPKTNKKRASPLMQILQGVSITPMHSGSSRTVTLPSLGHADTHSGPPEIKREHELVKVSRLLGRREQTPSGFKCSKVSTGLKTETFHLSRPAIRSALHQPREFQEH